MTTWRAHEAYEAKSKLFIAIYEVDPLAMEWVVEHDIHPVPNWYDVALMPISDVRPDLHYIVANQTHELRAYAKDYLTHFRPAIRQDGNILVIVPVQ